MSNRDGRMKVDQQRAAESDRMKSIPLTLRVTPTLASRMRAIARAKGYATVAEWVRSVVVSALA